MLSFLYFAGVVKFADLPAGSAGLPAGRQARGTQSMPQKEYENKETVYFVYALKSIRKNYIYVGLTKNVVNRQSQHNTGKEKTTKPYAPFILIYTEKFFDRKLARTKEKYLKSGCGKEFLKNISHI